MKNFFHKIMSTFHKPILPLTIEQGRKIEGQITSYNLEIAKATIGMAFAESSADLSHYSMVKSMAKHRIAVLKIRLLKGCECGRNHTEDIQAEENIKKMFSEQLLLFIDGK